MASRKRPDKTFVEMLYSQLILDLTEAVKQLSISLELSADGKEDPGVPPALALKGLWSVAVVEVEKAHAVMEPYRESQLKAKHRICRRMINLLWDEVLSDEDYQTIAHYDHYKDVNGDSLAISFVKKLATFIEKLHIALTEDSRKRQRVSALFALEGVL